jgi:tetratricopeptide (TPR) repeat protein
MTLGFDVSGAEYRLARHYLNRLRTLDEAVSRGQANVAYGLATFDQEWEQIRHWQMWTTQREPEDRRRAELCKEFPFAGLEILANRNSADQADWLQAALEAAQQLHDKEAERALTYELMMSYYRLGAVDMIKHFASQLLTLGEAANHALSMERAYFGLAAYSEERGKYADAEHYLQRALQLALKLGIVVETGRILNALGSVAGCVGEFQKSYEYFLHYLELMETHGKKSKVCHALLSLGESLISLKDHAQAERYLLRAVSMCRALGFQRFLGVGLLNLGSLAIEQGKLETARRYLLEGLQAVRALGIQRQIIAGLTALGYVDLRLGDFAGAFEYLNQGLELAREGGGLAIFAMCSLRGQTCISR